MKLSANKSPISKLNKFIENYKYEKHQKELNRLVNLENVTQADAHAQLYDAREVLANYAKANNVRLSFRTVPEEKLSITVMNKQNVHNGTINSDTSAIETVERPIERMLEDKDGLNYIWKGKESHEDNFLKRVYRQIDMLTYSIKPKNK